MTGETWFLFGVPEREAGRCQQHLKNLPVPSVLQMSV